MVFRTLSGENVWGNRVTIKKKEGDTGVVPAKWAQMQKLVIV